MACLCKKYAMPEICGKIYAKYFNLSDMVFRLHFTTFFGYGMLRSYGPKEPSRYIFFGEKYAHTTDILFQNSSLVILHGHLFMK